MLGAGAFVGRVVAHCGALAIQTQNSNRIRVHAVASAGTIGQR